MYSGWGGGCLAVAFQLFNYDFSIFVLSSECFVSLFIYCLPPASCLLRFHLILVACITHTHTHTYFFDFNCISIAQAVALGRARRGGGVTTRAPTFDFDNSIVELLRQFPFSCQRSLLGNQRGRGETQQQRGAESGVPLARGVGVTQHGDSIIRGAIK